MANVADPPISDDGDALFATVQRAVIDRRCLAATASAVRVAVEKEAAIQAMQWANLRHLWAWR